MSDDHHYAGGHELEGLNAMNLFKIFVGLGLVTLLAATAVVQWFYQQREDLILARAEEGSFLLDQHREDVDGDLKGIAKVRKGVLGEGGGLEAAAPPPGWVHPDDLAGTGAAAPAPTPEPEPVPAEGGEGEGAEGDAPAEGEGAAPAEGDEKAPAEGDAPAKKEEAPKKEEPKPEKKEAPKKKEPKKDEPADDKPAKKKEDGGE